MFESLAAAPSAQAVQHNGVPLQDYQANWSTGNITTYCIKHSRNLTVTCMMRMAAQSACNKSLIINAPEVVHIRRPQSAPSSAQWWPPRIIGIQLGTGNITMYYEKGRQEPDSNFVTDAKWIVQAVAINYYRKIHYLYYFATGGGARCSTDNGLT
ncbi:MAG: hypothetical protein IPO92_12870 [Saprospiraceae bacterium]|nr:hypothetical protein [Saprospiraceae bacterium]